MTPSGCAERVPFERLVGYWLDDPPPPDPAAFEAHLLACAACASRLDELVALDEAIRRAAGEVRLRGALMPAILDRLARDRRVVRRYGADAGGHIHCTALADDDLVALELSADLQGIERVDLLYCAEDGTILDRAMELPVVRERTVVWAEPGELLRKMPTCVSRVRLIAVDAGRERLIAEYTLHHTAYRPS